MSDKQVGVAVVTTVRDTPRVSAFEMIQPQGTRSCLSASRQERSVTLSYGRLSMRQQIIIVVNTYCTAVGTEPLSGARSTVIELSEAFV